MLNLFQHPIIKVASMKVTSMSSTCPMGSRNKVGITEVVTNGSNQQHLPRLFHPTLI